MPSVIRWIKANIAQYGGDPNRIVLWGESAGPSLIAGYLAHPQFYGPGGHGVEGAILNFGFYGHGAAGVQYFLKEPQELAAPPTLGSSDKAKVPHRSPHTR